MKKRHVKIGNNKGEGKQINVKTSKLGREMGGCNAKGTKDYQRGRG